MKLDCSLADSIQNDFSKLWKCTKRGNTLEVTTPYLLPDSTLFALFITEKDGRYIVCDGGSVQEVLEEYCPLPAGEMESALSGFAAKFGMKLGLSPTREPLFFKDCSEVSLVSSIAFDVASFATMATSALVAASNDSEAGSPATERFKAQADSFIREIKPTGMEIAQGEIDEVPGVKFSTVLKTNSRVWLVSYVTGSNLSYFLRSLSYTYLNFDHVWKSRLANGGIGRTIPLLDDRARGYEEDKMKWQMAELARASHGPLVKWSNKDEMGDLLRTIAPPL